MFEKRTKHRRIKQNHGCNCRYTRLSDDKEETHNVQIEKEICQYKNIIKLVVLDVVSLEEITRTLDQKIWKMSSRK